MSRITIGSTCWKEIDVIPTAALGSAIAGGYLICKSGGVAWIVAPAATQVSRTWYCRNDAVTTAQASAACGDWFVPTCGQLQNPGFSCRTNWDSYSATIYWSGSENSNIYGWYVNLNSNSAVNTLKTDTYLVRAFRCVTY